MNLSEEISISVRGLIPVTSSSFTNKDELLRLAKIQVSREHPDFTKFDRLELGYWYKERQRWHFVDGKVVFKRKG